MPLDAADATAHPRRQGLTQWIQRDFRSPRFLRSDVQDGWNRKCLIRRNGAKNKAFAVLKELYDKSLSVVSRPTE